MFKRITFYILILLTQTCFSQEVLNRFSVKTGYSISVTQWGVSPFAEIRRWDRSIGCVFFNLQYSQPIKKNELNIGLQLIEKGFRTQYSFAFPNSSTNAAYQIRLNYIELPVNYVHRIGKYNIIFGAVLSYLYENNYRFEETDVNIGNPTIVFASNYSYTENWNRYNKWDFGVNIGMSYRLHKNFDAEFTIQKHFIDVDTWQQRDLDCNLSFLLGLRYRFLSYK